MFPTHPRTAESNLLDARCRSADTTSRGRDADGESSGLGGDAGHVRTAPRGTDGEGVATWNRRIKKEGLDDEKSLRAWLTKQGVFGYAQTFLVMERFGYPDFMTATADELIDGQYADRPQLRPTSYAVFCLTEKTT